MKKQKTIVLSFLITALCAVSAYAAQNPNLRVTLQGPSTAAVYSPYQYTVTVKNIGNAPAANVKIAVDFPETDTSPNKYILGTLSGIQYRVLPGGHAEAAVHEQYGQSRKQPAARLHIQLRASDLDQDPVGKSDRLDDDSQRGRSAEQFPNGNAGAVVWVDYHPGDRDGCADLDVHGRGLTSFFECEIFPSSQQIIYSRCTRICRFRYMAMWWGLGTSPRLRGCTCIWSTAGRLSNITVLPGTAPVLKE